MFAARCRCRRCSLPALVRTAGLLPPQPLLGCHPCMPVPGPEQHAATACMLLGSAHTASCGRGGRSLQPATPVGLRALACLARVQCCGSGWAWIYKRRVTNGHHKVHRPPQVAIGAPGPSLRREPDPMRSIQAAANFLAEPSAAAAINAPASLSFAKYISATSRPKPRRSRDEATPMARPDAAGERPSCALLPRGSGARHHERRDPQQRAAIGAARARAGTARALGPRHLKIGVQMAWHYRAVQRCPEQRHPRFLPTAALPPGHTLLPTVCGAAKLRGPLAQATAPAPTAHAPAPPRRAGSVIACASVYAAAVRCLMPLPPRQLALVRTAGLLPSWLHAVPIPELHTATA